MKNRPLQRSEIPYNRSRRQSKQAEAATGTIQTELQVPSSKRGRSAPKNACTRESEIMETSPKKQARLAPVNPDEHTGQCKRTGGCYNELVVAFYSTGGGVKGKKIYTS